MPTLSGLAMMKGKGSNTYGPITQKAKRTPTLSQLMALSETRKYSADDVDTAANVNHCDAVQQLPAAYADDMSLLLTSQLTMTLSSTSCISPNHLLL